MAFVSEWLTNTLQQQGLVPQHEHSQNPGWSTQSPSRGWAHHILHCGCQCRMGYCCRQGLGWLDGGRQAFSPHFLAWHVHYDDDEHAVLERAILLHVVQLLHPMHEPDPNRDDLSDLWIRRCQRLSVDLPRPPRIHAIYVPRVFIGRQQCQAGYPDGGQLV